jgi:hypothetical protein
MYSELKFINKIYLEKSIGSGFTTDLERTYKAERRMNRIGKTKKKNSTPS